MNHSQPTLPIDWSLVDPLGEALQHLRMNGLFYCHSELAGTWGATLPPMEGYLMFHVVLTGHCWLDIPGCDPLLLKPGEFAMVPHGEGHNIQDDPQTACVDLFSLEREELSDRYERLKYGTQGERTTMICGAVHFEHPAASRLLTLLPHVIHVTKWGDIEGEWVQSTLRMLELETRTMRPGGDAVITRLADILVLQTLRWWIQHEKDKQEGWLGALQDERIGRAMALIHRHPERDWTVPLLASEVAMSRSGFSARFTQLVGEPPMKYLTYWRMQLAWEQLREDAQLSLYTLADKLGYRSEAAFSRAFKRHTGISPGAARKQLPSVHPQ
ncbi:MAG: AraC family transcriptional regulator [Deltaproteobacteria bacterium]|nr:AraC family transcriptional regulator [Deltaproteobacteria bacterium]|tara:strand:+ start:10186 stop:11169 length:984 start_codon:yes stop_codon:yes gene_type:complete